MTKPPEVPKIASSEPPPVSSAQAAVVSQPPPAKAVAAAPVPAPVPPPAKPVISSTSLPKLTQPMPLASRPPLANVSRGVAAAFHEQEDDDTETTNVKTSAGISASVAAPTTSMPESYSTAKKVETNRLAAARPPEPVPPPLTSAVTTKSAATKGDFVMGLSGMSFSDMVLAAQSQKAVSGMPYDRGDAKGLGPDHPKARTSGSNRLSSAKTSYRSKRPGPDSRGRKKLEIGRNVM